MDKHHAYLTQISNGTETKNSAHILDSRLAVLLTPNQFLLRMQSKTTRNFIFGGITAYRGGGAKLVNMEELEPPPSQFLEISDNLQFISISLHKSLPSSSFMVIQIVLDC